MPTSPANADKIARDLIIKHEGQRSKPYLCPAGKITIGIGRNIEDVGLSQDEINYLFANDMKTARMTCRKLFRDFSAIPETRQAALLDMALNLGQPRLSRFVKMREAVDLRDWQTAAAEAKDSAWYRQVGRRGEKIVSILETGRV